MVYTSVHMAILLYFIGIGDFKSISYVILHCFFKELKNNSFDISNFLCD